MSADALPPPSQDPASARVRLEPPHAYILERLQKGRVIPFLGAGASLVGRPSSAVWKGPASGFLPRSAELAEYLDERSSYPSGVPTELTRVAQYFDGVMGRGGLDDELHDVFAREYTPSRLHHWLAGLDNIIIVTTNYDRLLERAFQQRQRPYHLVVYRTGAPTFLFYEHGTPEPREVQASDLTIDFGTTPIIYKMHGTADPAMAERDSYVITEDDYVEFLSRMVTSTAIPTVFAEPFRRSHFLFLGYGLRDWNLRVILHRIWRDLPRRFASWAIQHRAEPLESEFWSKRGLTIYESGIDEFLDQLGVPKGHGG
ncbi:MAG: SIR2 family protein [Acidobacteria bacterium]|nr:SIR2 family protein [Acidobacteriota bacterium]